MSPGDVKEEPRLDTEVHHFNLYSHTQLRRAAIPLLKVLHEELPKTPESTQRPLPLVTYEQEARAALAKQNKPGTKRANTIELNFHELPRLVNYRAE